MDRTFSVSVDLDEIRCYLSIHGLGNDLAAGAADAVYDRCISRFLDLFSELGVSATFFVIGSDLERPENRAWVQAIHNAGHEVANHSYGHAYDLSQWDEDRILGDLQRAQDAIHRCVGEAPVGFRAPGYTLSPTLKSAIAEVGFAYSSSAFPSPAYYGAKALALAWIRARGRQSHSVLGTPRVLASPAEPHRHGSVVEIPMTVGPRWLGGVPLIGTTVVLGNKHSNRLLCRSVMGRSHVHLECHGIDLADAKQDGLQALAKHQPDLRRTLDHKRQQLDRSIRFFLGQGYRPATLASVAQLVG